MNKQKLKLVSHKKRYILNKMYYYVVITPANVFLEAKRKPLSEFREFMQTKLAERVIASKIRIFSKSKKEMYAIANDPDKNLLRLHQLFHNMTLGSYHSPFSPRSFND